MTDIQHDAADVLDAPAGDRLIKLAEVCRTVGLGKTSIYRLVNAGEFPRPISMVTGETVEGGIRSPRVRWSANEIQQWIAARLAARAR